MFTDKMLLRAHHGMCLAFHEGKGYSAEFTDHMGQVLAYLNEKDPIVRILAQTDEICGKCPGNHDGICSDREKTDRYDWGVLEAVGLKPGDELSYSSFRKLVDEKVIQSKEREKICGDCSWNVICSRREKSIEKE